MTFLMLFQYLESRKNVNNRPDNIVDLQGVINYIEIYTYPDKPSYYKKTVLMSIIIIII